jgi:hypothetical protein
MATSFEFDCSVDINKRTAASPSQDFLPPILSSQAVRNAKLTREDFKTVLDLKHGSLALRLGYDSALEWCLTYKDVEPGEELNKQSAFSSELNEKLGNMVAALPYKGNMPSGWKVEYNYKDEGFEVTKKQDVMVFSTTLIEGSLNRYRSNKMELNGESRDSMNEFLEKRNQTWVNNNHVRFATALFRIFAGFPEEFKVLATDKDPGDLCQGKIILTDIKSHNRDRVTRRAWDSDNELVGSVTSYRNGVYGTSYGAPGSNTPANKKIGVFGGFSSEVEDGSSGS